MPESLWLSAQQGAEPQEAKCLVIILKPAQAMRRSVARLKGSIRRGRLLPGQMLRPRPGSSLPRHCAGNWTFRRARFGALSGEWPEKGKEARQGAFSVSALWNLWHQTLPPRRWLRPHRGRRIFRWRASPSPAARAVVLCCGSPSTSPQRKACSELDRICAGMAIRAGWSPETVMETRTV